jgi:hypothetical protein
MTQGNWRGVYRCQLGLLRMPAGSVGVSNTHNVTYTRFDALVVYLLRSKLLVEDALVCDIVRTFIKVLG